MIIVREKSSLFEPLVGIEKSLNFSGKIYNVNPKDLQILQSMCASWLNMFIKRKDTRYSAVIQ